jgi:hypothetical protein
MNTTEPVQVTEATTQATTQTATEAAIQAVEAAQSEWTGCHDDEEATPEWVAQSEDAAASAAGCGNFSLTGLLATVGLKRGGAKLPNAQRG